MKAKLKNINGIYGQLKDGQVVEFFPTNIRVMDSNNLGWYLDDSKFDVIQEGNGASGGGTSLRDLLGQDVKTLEFK